MTTTAQLRRGGRYIVPSFTAREDAVFPLPDLPSGPATVVGLGPLRADAKVAYTSEAIDAAGPLPSLRIPVFAVRSGLIINVSRRFEGLHIAIDHGSGYTSHYGGLIESELSPENWCRHGVTRGQVIGYIGAHPNAPMGPLRFALYRGCTGNGVYISRAVRPMKILPCWQHVTLDTLPAQRAA